MPPRKEDSTKSKAELLNFESARERQIEEKRRAYERVLFRNVLGVYTVMEQKGLHAIELVDISEGGLLFQVSHRSDLVLNQDDVLNLRLYFSSDSFLPIRIKVMRIVDSIENGEKVRQYGCKIDKSFKSYQAIYHFVQFITACAEHGHEDRDSLKIYY